MYKNVTIIACLLLTIMLTGCGVLESFELPQGEGGIDVSKGKVISENDTHGFHGDGMYFSEIKFSDDFTVSQIKENEYWQKMPLSKNLNEFIYEPLDGGIKIPKVTNGYYYFYDRHSESSNPYDDTELLNRGSYNFTVMIYDCDTDTLYVCREDT